MAGPCPESEAGLADTAAVLVYRSQRRPNPQDAGLEVTRKLSERRSLENGSLETAHRGPWWSKGSSVLSGRGAKTG